VPTFARSLFQLADLRSAATRRLALAIGSAATLSVALLLAAAPAGAVRTLLGGQEYGIEPHATHEDLFVPNIFGLQYEGGPVMHANAVYAIYWDPAVLRPGDPGSPGKYQGDWQKLINSFLEGVASESGTLGNVFALTAQYTESGGARAAYNTTFRGGYVDHDTYPSDECTDPDQSLNKNFACFTDQQIREELASFITANKLHAGKETIFFMMTPPGVTICIEAGHCSDSSDVKPWGTGTSPEKESYKRSFCSYHSTTAIPGGETALYAAIPWTAGTLGSALKPAHQDGSDCQDGTGIIEEPNQDGLSPEGTYDHALPDILINQIASELIATVTDPMLNGWYEPVSGDEVPDQCRNWFEEPPIVQGSDTVVEHTEAGTYSNQTIGGANYYLNTEFNQAGLYYGYPGLPCELHANVVPSFTAPSPVKSGDLAAFDGNESDITLEQSADATPSSQPLYRATFSWNFGDGSTVSGPGYSESNPSAPLYASVLHSYQYGGTYDVTLTVTDVGGNTASVTHQVTVDGPGPPVKEQASENAGQTTAGSSGSSGSSSTGATGTSAPAPAPVPNPVAADAVVSQSLRNTLRKGLVVRYSVNEQVAGHFEVLLNRAVARRLGIGGAPAVDLPAGYPPELVVAKAILITTKGGRSAVDIQFSKRTAARLGRLSKVSLILRLVVRNAASSSPATTTVLSTVTLSG
jgi:hypothetical protein